MLNTTPHTVTRSVDDETVSLVFYPDTGCLRFADSRGLCHELRPPHSWLALTCASRGVRNGAHAVSDGLSVLLRDFCAKRQRWMCGPVHAGSHHAVQAMTSARALAAHRPLEAPAHRADPVGVRSPVHASPRSAFGDALAATP